MALLTNDDITNAVNAVGFDLPGLTTALGLLKSLVDAGFTDPGIFISFMARYKLRDDKAKLQAQAAMLQADQQKQLQLLVEETNPAIGELNNQIAAIDAQLALLQG